MILIFLLSWNINFYHGFLWLSFPEDISFYYYHTHGIEIELKNFSYRIDLDDVRTEEIYWTDDLWFNCYAKILTFGISRVIRKNTFWKFKLGLRAGIFTYDVTYYGIPLPGDEFVSFILTPSFQIVTQIPKTNLLVGFTSFYYKEFFRRNTTRLRGGEEIWNPDLPRNFTLFFNIGFKIK